MWSKTPDHQNKQMDTKGIYGVLASSPQKSRSRQPEPRINRCLCLLPLALFQKARHTASMDD